MHTPDLFDGERPATLQDGIALTQRIGGEVLDKRADLVVADLPQRLVYAGFSFGAGTAQRLAQTRPGAGRRTALRGLPLRSPASGLSGRGPTGVPVQIHGMEEDPFFGLEGDIDAARELVETVGAQPAGYAFRLPGRQAPVHRQFAVVI